MADFVLEIVLENLISLVRKELVLFLGFDQDLERLSSLFATIKATLQDAEEKQFSNAAIKDWLGKLKYAAHVLDDFIDECAYEGLGLENQGVMCGPSDKILKLDRCSRLKMLPNSLVCLKALQQLSFNGCPELSRLPPRIGKLTSLRILPKFFVGKERGFRLEELGPLKLKGDLDIKHLENVKSVMDVKEANMSSKQLNKLFLSWEKNENCELEDNVEETLEVLQPDTQQLWRLEVDGYEGAHFPQWISSLSLKYLNLKDCKNCLQLPPLYKLPSLNTLRILNMIHVEYLYEESYDGEVVFRALEELTLRRLPNLKSSGRFAGFTRYDFPAGVKINGSSKARILARLLWRHSLASHI
ncbi:Putative disease resistance protein RGA4 [Glycine soja]|uniref:Putative disease resistance protein RGA4 n=1 Tax=Glycine soja TaxID=3848 RepID=A0A0B2QNG4_GLYSO|nr:Putative disease resistance protein RGA4 [Glycine soja]